MKKIFILVVLVLSTVLTFNRSTFALHLQSDRAQAPVTQYPIAGKPLNLVVEAPGRLWFTMPDENSIGSLVVDGAGDATFTAYPALTANSEPYDLVYDADNQLIWFSQRSANRIGRLDMATGAITEPVVLETGRRPAGIALAPNGLLWFVESNANKLASYDPSAQMLQEYDYTPFNITGNAELEDVAVENNDRIWLTAPKDSEVVQFVPSNNRFFRSFFLSRLGTEEPFSIALSTNGRAWVTDIGSNQVSVYSPGTLTFWARYGFRSTESMPVGIALDTNSSSNNVLLTQNASGRLARLPDLSNTADNPLELPVAQASRPWGIAVDDNGSVWVADNGASAIIEWHHPFFYTNYLPLVR